MPFAGCRTGCVILFGSATHLKNGAMWAMCRTALGEELTLSLGADQQENTSGFCTKVLMDMQKFLVCTMMMDCRAVVQGAAPVHNLSAEQVSDIKIVLANTSSSSPRCTLLLRSSSRLKTAVEIVCFDAVCQVCALNMTGWVSVFNFPCQGRPNVWPYGSDCSSLVLSNSDSGDWTDALVKGSVSEHSCQDPLDSCPRRVQTRFDGGESQVRMHSAFWQVAGVDFCNFSSKSKAWWVGAAPETDLHLRPSCWCHQACQGFKWQGSSWQRRGITKDDGSVACHAFGVPWQGVRDGAIHQGDRVLMAQYRWLQAGAHVCISGMFLQSSHCRPGLLVMGVFHWYGF